MRLLAYLISIHVLLRYNSGTFIAQKGNFCKADLELFEMTLGRKRKFMVVSEIQYFSFFSEQLQLLSRCVRLLRLATVKKLDICKLLVSNTKHTDFTIRWQQTLDSAHMHLCILHAATMTNVYRKLKHGEPIAL